MADTNDGGRTWNLLPMRTLNGNTGSPRAQWRWAPTVVAWCGFAGLLVGCPAHSGSRSPSALSSSTTSTGASATTEPTPTPTPKSPPPPDHPVGSLIPIGHVAGPGMWFVDTRHGFGVVDLRLVRTDDGGRTWRVVGSPIPTDDLGYAPGKAIFTSLSDGYLYDRGLRVTHDGGATWHDPNLNRYVDRRDGPTDATILVLQPRGASVWVLVGCPPGSQCHMELHVSEDAGLTWRTQSSPMIRDDGGFSTSLDRVSDRKAYAVAAAGIEPDATPYHHIAITDDGGVTWRYVADPCGHDTVAEFMAGSGEEDLWLVCGGEPATAMEGKEVFRSSDGGEHWDLRASVLAGELDVGGIPASGHVDGLVAVSSTRAYLGLGRVTQFRTVDGGRTWTASFWYNADVGGSPVNFVDPTHGWGTGEFHLHQTVDGLLWRDLGGSHP